jgi:hypothetical protein
MLQLPRVTILLSAFLLIPGCGYQLVQTEEPERQQQETMQKKVNILENVVLPDGRAFKGDIADVLRGACARKAISQSEFDSLLMSGATVVSSIKWDESIKAEVSLAPINVAGREYSGRCLGQSYILEGSRDLLYLL